VLIGNASYSIYLTHLMSISVASKLLGSVHATSLWVAPTEYVGLVALAIILGFLTYWLLERPLLKWLSRDKRAVPADAQAAELQNKAV